MKKILCFLLIFSFCLICSCGTDENSTLSQSSSSVDNSKEATNSSAQDESKDIMFIPGGEGTKNLMSSITPSSVSVLDDLEKGNKAYNDFAVELFKRSLSKEGKNALISPLSAIYALGLSANGAGGETLKQMENMFGVSVDELNEYLYSYMKQKAEKDAAKLSIANSIWFADRFQPLKTFLQKNADYYNAAAYKADFNDEKTVADINGWVNEKTKGMIEEIIKEIDPDDVMFLINALAFEDEWEKPYDSKYNVKEGEFTTSNGEKVKAEFMYSDSEKYIYDENAEGFIKKYKGNYAFAALLPKEGMSIEEYVSTLNGEKISQILGRKEYFSFELYTQLPKFETDYTIQLKDVLKDMGMKDAFVPHVADFTKTGDAYGLHISSVLQKTYISVGEKGTRAGAVTAITYLDESCPMETKTVALNRPFVYMLIDTTTNTPFFIGTMMNPS